MRSRESPEAAAKAAWVLLLEAGCCVSGVQSSLAGYVGRSRRFQYMYLRATDASGLGLADTTR